MDNHTDHPLTLTVEQAAKLLGIGRSTVYELVHTGDIPSLRLGRRIVVPKARLAEFLGEPDLAHGTESPTRAAQAPDDQKGSPRPPTQPSDELTLF